MWIRLAARFGPLALIAASPVFAAPGDDSAVAALKAIKTTCERAWGGMKPRIWSADKRWNRKDEGIERIDVDVAPTGNLVTTHKGVVELVYAITEQGTYKSEQAARSDSAAAVQSRTLYRADLDYRDNQWLVRGGAAVSQHRMAGQVVTTNELALSREELMRSNGALGMCGLGDSVR